MDFQANYLLAMAKAKGTARRHSRQATTTTTTTTTTTESALNSFNFSFACMCVCVCVCVASTVFKATRATTTSSLSVFPFLSISLSLSLAPSLSLSLFDKYAQDIVYWRSASGEHKEAGGGAGQAGRVCVAWTAWLNASAWHLLAQRATAALPANYAATCTLFCLFSFLLLLQPSLVGFWCHNCVRDFVRASRTSIDAFWTIKFWFDAMSCKSVSHVKVAQTTTTLLHVIGIR